jgi:AcrR family transcriptional regulator
MNAAARVLLDRGYAGTRLADIADEAGLQAGSLYYHFDSKEKLVEEVLRYGVQFAHAHVRATVEELPESATPGERLEAAVRGFLEATLELGDMSPAHIRTFHQLPPDIQERLRPVRRAFGRFWEELVDAAISAGDVRGDIDPYILRVFIINALERVSDIRPRSRRAASELSATMRTLIFDGIGNAATPSEDVLTGTERRA